MMKPDPSEEFLLEEPLELQPADRVEDGALPPATESNGTPKPTARETPKRNASRPTSSRAFFSRGWALVVDLVLLAIASSMLPSFARVGIRAAEGVTGRFELYEDILIRQLTSWGDIALIVGYFVFMNASGGQTLGKSLMGLRVVRADGAPLDAMQSLIRFVGYIFSLMPLGIGFLVAAFAPRRGLHDYLAGTIVVRPRDMPIATGKDTPP